MNGGAQIYLEISGEDELGRISPLLIGIPGCGREEGAEVVSSTKSG